MARKTRTEIVDAVDRVTRNSSPASGDVWDEAVRTSAVAARTGGGPGNRGVSKSSEYATSKSKWLDRMPGAPRRGEPPPGGGLSLAVEHHEAARAHSAAASAIEILGGRLADASYHRSMAAGHLADAGRHLAAAGLPVDHALTVTTVESGGPSSILYGPGSEERGHRGHKAEVTVGGRVVAVHRTDREWEPVPGSRTTEAATVAAAQATHDYNALRDVVGVGHSGDENLRTPQSFRRLAELAGHAKNANLVAADRQADLGDGAWERVHRDTAAAHAQEEQDFSDVAAGRTRVDRLGRPVRSTRK